jgi:hypothetical protein
MNRASSLILLVAVMVMAGCQSIPKPAPGMASLRVKLIAEPKQGLRDDRPGMNDYGATGPIDLGKGDFERVDYAGLADIVVWAEPQARSTSAPAAPAAVTIVVNARKAATDSLSAAACVGQQLVFRNAGSGPANVYSVSDGNDFDLGALAPGASAAYTVRSAGLIEVLTDTAKDPIAQVYAAPSPWVKVGRSGQSIDFADLPPGPCKVVSWHARLPGYETQLTLAPDRSATTSIKVGVNALPKVAGRR